MSRLAPFMLAAIVALPLVSGGPGTDPFAFFRPTFSLTAAERTRLDHGESIARALSTSDEEIAIVAAAPVAVDADRVVAWMRRIDALKRSSYVLAIGRFSDPPRVEDLGGLTLDNDDLSDIRACHPGDCGLKLTAPEIARVQAAAAGGSGDRRAPVQQAFRQVVLDRVTSYLATGDATVPEGRTAGGSARSRLGVLVNHSAFLDAQLPDFAAYLRDRAQQPPPGVETFVYWSKERIARKPVISVTHVSMMRGRQSGEPDVIVAGLQIFATHYYDASLGVTALLRGEPGGANYLVYVNRSEIDVLDGPLSGVTRWFLRRRLRSEATTVLDGLRRRLESGEPQR